MTRSKNLASSPTRWAMPPPARQCLVELRTEEDEQDVRRLGDLEAPAQATLLPAESPYHRTVRADPALLAELNHPDRARIAGAAMESGDERRNPLKHVDAVVNEDFQGGSSIRGQDDINARLSYNGLGVDPRTERPAPRTIAGAVGRVLADQAIAGNVRRVRAELESYAPLTTIRRRLAEDAGVAA